MGFLSSLFKKKTLREDMDSASDWIIKAMASSGYTLDYSKESIREIERFFVDNMENGKPKSNGLLSDGIGRKVFAIGSYIALTLYKNYDWEIITDDSDEMGEVNISCKKGDAVIFPVQKVMKRFKDGESDNLSHYVLLIE